MNNPATSADVRADGYTGSTDAVLQRWLDKAWRALNAEDSMSTLTARLEARTEPMLADLVKDVIAAAALRVLRNPEGAEQRETAIDDWRESTHLADSSQDLYFTAAELRRIAPAAASAAPTGSFPPPRSCDADE